jgi:hypothetical protein
MARAQFEKLLVRGQGQLVKQAPYSWGGQGRVIELPQRAINLINVHAYP